MDRRKVFELLKFLENEDYLAGSLTAEQLIDIVMDEEGEMDESKRS